MAQVSKINLGGIDYDIRDKVLEQEVTNIKPIVNQGTINNAADEEDITSVDNLLKLKDRSNLNGMGYIILRKNKTFAEQITQPNTIYEIRYDFDLSKQSVSLPNDTILWFNGGSVANGTIVGNNTRVVADNKCHIFQSNLNLKGVFINNELSVCWFGAKNSFKNASFDKVDTAAAIQKALDVECSIGFSTIYFPMGGYYVSKSLNMSILKSIRFEGQSDGTILKDCATTQKLPSCACLFTDADNTILNIDIAKPQYNENVGTKYALCIEGGQFDVSLNPQYKSSVIHFTDKNKNTKLWGVNIETAIIGNPEMHRSDNDSKGIFLDLQNGGYITMLRTKCNILYFCTGFSDTEFANDSWATDWVDESIISARCAIRLQSLYDARLNGSYQCVAVFYNEEGPGIIEVFSHNVVVTAKIWDANTPVTVNGQQWKTNRYGLVIGDSAHGVTLEGVAKNLIYLFLVKGGQNQKSKTMDFDEANILTLAEANSSTTEVSGCVTNITALHKAFNSSGAATLSFATTGAMEGSAVIDIPVKENYYSKVLVHMSRKEGFVNSFNKVSFSLYKGATLVYGPIDRSVLSYDTQSEDCFLVWSIPKEYSRGNKLHIEFAEPIKGKYGQDACSIYNIKASTKYEEYRSSETADVIYASSNPTKPVVVLNGKYTEAQLEELGVGRRIACISDSGMRLKDIHGWGVPLLCNDGFTVMGGYALPSQTPTSVIRPTLYEDMTEGNVLFYHGNGGWREYDRAKPRVKRNGTFENKPVASDIYVGFQYFCTDRQTSEGATNGIVLYHKGNGVWVDALGRKVE